jgi:transcriptional/translational regulatory protein YebC/TACO1
MEKLFLQNTDWSSVKEKIKESNVEISDADLEWSPGKDEQLLTRLAQKLHKSREEIKGWIESIAVNGSLAG